MKSSLETDNPKNLLDSKKTMKTTHMRWVFLAVLCFVGLAYNFGNNIFAAISGDIQSYWKLSVPELNWIGSVYLLPNAIIPFVGGILLDKFGLKLMSFIFSIITTIAFVVWLVAAYKQAYWLILLGQCIFALSGENTCIAISCWIGKWFPKNEQGVAQAINVSVAHFWQAIFPYLTLIYYDSTEEKKSILISQWLMVIACLISVAITIVAGWMDTKSEKEEAALVQNVQDSSAEEGGGHGGFKLRDLCELNLQYWLLTMLLALGYSGVNKFQTNFQSVTEVRYSLSKDSQVMLQQVSLLMSIPILPAAGILVDKVGKRCELLFGSFIVIFAMYVMMYFGPTFPDEYQTAALMWVLIPQIFTGIAFGIFTAIIWSVIPLVVPDKVLGTAFGIVDASQSLCFAVVPLILGVIYSDESEKAASNYILFFLLLNAFNILLIGFIWIIDKRGDNKLAQVVKAANRKSSRFTSKGALKSAVYND